MAPSAAPPALSQQPQQEAQQPLHPFLLVWRCLPASLMDPAKVPLLVSLVQDKCVPDVQVPAQLGTTPLFSSSSIWIENITTPTNPYSAQMLSWWVSILLSYTGCISHRSQQMADIALVCSSNAADKPSHFSSTWAWGLSDVTWIKKLFFQKFIVQEQGSLNFQNYLTFKQKKQYFQQSWNHFTTLHLKQRRIPLPYPQQHEGRLSCPVFSFGSCRCSSHSQCCLLKEWDILNANPVLLRLQTTQV